MGRHPLVSGRARPPHGRGLGAVRRRSALARGARPHPARRNPHRCSTDPAQGADGVSPFLLTRTLPEDATEAALRADVLHGLTRTPKALPPKWFYDARGSELFEEITRLPEYYPTRAEREI
ncbi:L-histidine N(alpha)-methyltransferase, partial [Streptomyces lunaelactis]|uniref:L-histidine N(alpha)-methyltransferase n=1 Tax=Streptomyces lunaelactis TaxID=1535768 RepID=UPI002816288E